nr:YgjP-like metallopeptidase domain-containing protein [Ideonella alba]
MIAQVTPTLLAGQMHALLRQRHPEPNPVRDDRALFDYVNERKQRFLRNAPPIARIAYDAKIRLLQQALGTHTRRTQVQGGQLKSRREIRIATLFRDLPAAFLEMIVVHELAHLKEPEHDKAFYGLCTHMLGDYHQREFDLRLWLAADAVAAQTASS